MPTNCHFISQITLAAAALVVRNNTANVGNDVAMPPSRLQLTGLTSGDSLPAAGSRTNATAAVDGGVLVSPAADIYTASSDSPESAAASAPITITSRAGDNDGLLPPLVVRASAADGAGIGGVRLVADASGGPEHALRELSGEAETTGPDGLATFRRLKLRSAAADYVMSLRAVDYPRLRPVTVAVRVRSCQEGEVEVANLQACEPCPQGSYSFTPSQQCKPCVEGARCLGGATLVAEPGRWRSAERSTQVGLVQLRDQGVAGVRAQLLSSVRTGLM